MAKKIVDVTWQDKMSFKTNLDGHEIVVDAHEEVGGENKGPTPKPLMLVALGGCTGMDVVSILRKMKVEIEGLNIKVEGELTDEHPKYYHDIKIIYEFKGKDLPMAKLEKAVGLSDEKYCGVSALYKKAVKVSSEVRIVE